MISTDLIVIGAGPGGYETALRAAQSGVGVILIEKSELGGTCLNRGCIPTKALCRAAEIADSVRESAIFGITSAPPMVDFGAVMARKNDIVAELRNGVEQLLSGVTIVRGEAIFESSSVVRVESECFTAPVILIATGSVPAQIPIPGAKYALTSDELLNIDSLPERVTIIGAGVIGLEFASILRSLGSEVTVVETAAEILPSFDTEVAKRLRMALKRRGIDIILNASVTSIAADGAVRYTLKGKEKALPAATTVMAVGRRPVIPKGLAFPLTSRGFIKVDPSTMRIPIEGNTRLYAIGDVNGLCMLAHAATAQGEVVLGLRSACAPIPSAVFTHPEAAMTGLTEQQCIEKELSYTVLSSTFQANGKARALGQTDGIVKMIVSATDGTLIGCHIVGPHASDLIAEPNFAIAHRLPAASIRSAIHPHPTLSETLISAR
ncbi:MAG: dihydrolipoyl dehydrogenase [Duncaniella sp.]|nr:dihydrolipoyl dehydrogenase [Duncaniella sp.]